LAIEAKFWPVFAQLAEPLRLAMSARLPETFARLPVVAGFASAMTPKMTLGTSVSGPGASEV
jgi:hypothetical protein